MKITRKIQRHVELVIRRAMATDKLRPEPVVVSDRDPDKTSNEASK
jgi:hypothetical protein